MVMTFALRIIDIIEAVVLWYRAPPPRAVKAMAKDVNGDMIVVYFDGTFEVHS